MSGNGAKPWAAIAGVPPATSGFELDRIFEVALKNAEHRAWSRPGAWNDPDYLQIGWIGNARGGEPARTLPAVAKRAIRLHVPVVLMASPLFYSGDMAKLDDFTLNVLCNPEVIDINQDPLGQSASVIELDGGSFLMVKDLEDGKAVGFFNRGEFPVKLTAAWSVLGLTGGQTVRDAWRHQDLGVFDRQYQASVPRRGCVLLKLTPAPKSMTK